MRNLGILTLLMLTVLLSGCEKRVRPDPCAGMPDVYSQQMCISNEIARQQLGLQRAQALNGAYRQWQHDQAVIQQRGY